MSARNLLREWKINNISFYRKLNWSFYQGLRCIVCRDVNL
jgi:hypothetical protein